MFLVLLPAPFIIPVRVRSSHLYNPQILFAAPPITQHRHSQNTNPLFRTTLEQSQYTQALASSGLWESRV